MERQHLPFVDWLKAIGLGLIVHGHVAAATTTSATPPIYPKQLGVAFFLFAAGFTLAREEHSSWWVVYKRYFEVFAFGLAFAILMSLTGLLMWSDANASNYLPLALGANVFFNNFPANPTTWYIGTYLHLLVLWAVLLRRIPIHPWTLVAACGLEILLRAALVATLGQFVAYMALSNWITVLMLGLMLGRRNPAPPRTGAVAWLSLPLVLGWPIAMSAVDWQLTFPFMSLQTLPRLGGPVFVSMAASLAYLGYTWAAYNLVVLLPDNGFTRFLARNTVVVFVAHMPVYYAVEYVLREKAPTYVARVTIEFLICLIGLALVSEILRRVLRPEELRQRLGDWLQRVLRPEGSILYRA